jgi:hypothetical protein
MNYIYRIHKIADNQVYNVKEPFVLSWLKVEMLEPNPKAKLEDLQQTCINGGKATYGAIGGGSYIIVTKETELDKQNKA